MSKKFNAERPAKKLPYRSVGECYLLYKGKLVAQDAGHYLSLPGGGIDEGENPSEGTRRELTEELGAVLKGPLRLVSIIEWDWHPGWANTDKRKARYMQYRGERVYSFLGEVKSFGKPTSTEGDAWKGSKLMGLSRASKLAEKFYLEHTPPNQLVYNATKMNIISTINQMKK